MLQGYYDHWRNVTKSVLEVSGVLGSIAFQPVPTTFTQKAKERGGVSNPRMNWLHLQDRAS